MKLFVLFINLVVFIYFLIEIVENATLVGLLL